MLVVIGLLLIVLSFVLPALSGARGSGSAGKGIANIRQMAMGLSFYAADNRDLPPVLGPAKWPATQPWRFDFGNIGTGNWFEHSWLYSYAITAELGNTEVANAPGRSDLHAVKEHAGVRVSMSDFQLTNTLYARHDFFNWDTRTGPDQFGAQPLSNVTFPSDKGLLQQITLFHYPNYGPVLACCMVDLPSPVAFADLSVSEHILRRMPHGIFNTFGSGLLPPEMDPRTVPGGPVSDTVNGVRGRDRK